MNLHSCQLASDFDFSDGPSLGIRDRDCGEVVGTACDTSTRDLFIAAPITLAALKAILPYALSRCEDMEEIVEQEGGTWNQEQLEKARAAYAQAESAIAKAEGRSDA